MMMPGEMESLLHREKQMFTEIPKLTEADLNICTKYQLTPALYEKYFINAENTDSAHPAIKQKIDEVTKSLSNFVNMPEFIMRIPLKERTTEFIRYHLTLLFQDTSMQMMLKAD